MKIDSQFPCGRLSERERPEEVKSPEIALNLPWDIKAFVFRGAVLMLTCGLAFVIAESSNSNLIQMNSMGRKKINKHKVKAQSEYGKYNL